LEILGVKVPIKPTPGVAKRSSSTLKNSKDTPKTLLPALLGSAEATPKAATSGSSLSRAKRLYQDLCPVP
jgi:hypothetical protein